MAVTSTTIGGVNCWQFSGAVTQAEITSAWGSLIVSGEYVPARSLYFDATCDLTAVQGGFSVNMTTGSNTFILHTGRDKSKTVLRYWNVRLTTGLAVGSRGTRVATWNGSTFSYPSNSDVLDDGLSLYGGSLTYSVQGNPGGGDPRYLDEFAISSLGGGVQISSSAYTEQELQPDIRGVKELSDVTFTRCFGFPQATGTISRQIMWRCYENTMHPTQKPIRIFLGPSQCFVNSTVRRSGSPVTTSLVDAYGSSAGSPSHILVLNNWKDESWFGASKTSLPLSSWIAQNSFRGGVSKRLQFVGVGANGTIKTYDSRSTTAPQRGGFVGTASSDFLAAGTSVQTDADGKVWIVSIGADVNGSAQIARYTGQKYTFQAFGYRVAVTPVDVTAGGDDNNSAYAPVVPTVQTGLSRTQSAINSATTIDTFHQLLEELHVLAIGLSGAASYAGAYTGNLFTFDGVALTTAFTTATVDATASNKISYNPATNALTIKSSTLSTNSIVGSWVNSTGTISTANGATITGTYTDSTGTRVTIKERTGKLLSTYVTVNGTAEGGTMVDGAFVNGWVPLSAARVITVQPTDAVRIAASYFGSKPSVFNLTGADIAGFTLSLDTETAVDTTVNTTTRDAISNSFNTYVNGSVLEVTINRTFKQYTDVEVLAGLDYYIVSRGYSLHSSMAALNSTAFYSLSAGTVAVYTSGFKIRVADFAADGTTPLVPSVDGYEVPLVVFYQDPQTGAKSTMTMLNAHGSFLGTAPWTKITANIGDLDKAAIANQSKLAIESSAIVAKDSTVLTRASQASVNAIPSAAQTAEATWSYQGERTLRQPAPVDSSFILLDDATDYGDGLLSVNTLSLAALESNKNYGVYVGNVYTPLGELVISQTTENSEGALVRGLSFSNPLGVPYVPTAGALLQTIGANTIVSTREQVAALGSPAQATALATLASTNQTEHDATQTAIAAMPAPLNSSQTQAAAAAALVAYDAVVPADLAGLAKAVEVEAVGNSVVALGYPLQQEAFITAYTAPDNTGIAAIKAKTDNLPAQPAAVGSSMTLTAVYDPAKTAATQASVNALPNATQIAAQVETAILTDGDGKAVLQAIADKIGNENLSAAVVASAVRTELAPELGKVNSTDTKTDELHRIHGLNMDAPLVVTPTARTAGAINQTLTGDGVASTTVTRVI